MIAYDLIKYNITKEKEGRETEFKDNHNIKGKFNSIYSNQTDMKELIKEVLSDTASKEGMHVNTIVDAVILRGGGDSDSKEALTKKINAILSQDVKRKSGSDFAKVINSKTKVARKGYYKLYSKKVVTGPKVDPPVVKVDDDFAANPTISKMNLFTGKAGECAVMSELLFRGYNVNTLMVDDGVDVIASKNNIFYLIQVKTSELKSVGGVNIGRVYATIKKDRFDAYLGFQIRYIIVARCKISNIETNLYFVFDNKDIDRFLTSGCLNGNEQSINIKIEYDSKEGKPYIYHENKKQEISFYMNKFDL